MRAKWHLAEMKRIETIVSKIQEYAFCGISCLFGAGEELYLLSRSSTLRQLSMHSVSGAQWLVPSDEPAVAKHLERCGRRSDIISYSFADLDFHTLQNARMREFVFILDDYFDLDLGRDSRRCQWRGRRPVQAEEQPPPNCCLPPRERWRTVSAPISSLVISMAALGGFGKQASAISTTVLQMPAVPSTMRQLAERRALDEAGSAAGAVLASPSRQWPLDDQMFRSRQEGSSQQWSSRR